MKGYEVSNALGNRFLWPGSIDFPGPLEFPSGGKDGRDFVRKMQI
jgi:hypothetical protein